MPICSHPGCYDDAVWKNRATTPAIEGEVFYTCGQHTIKSDDREWIGEGEPPAEVMG